MATFQEAEKIVDWQLPCLSLRSIEGKWGESLVRFKQNRQLQGAGTKL